MSTDVQARLRAPATLCLAAVLVGIAIVWDGVGARLLNGVGGVIWIASCVAQIWAVRSDSRRWVLGGAVLVSAVILAVVVRPSDGLIAVLGFGAGGAAIALLATRRRVAWAVLLTAIWLPVHLAVAIASAIVRGLTDSAATIRTDPPPTTAVVPALMVLAAWGAGALVTWIRVSAGRKRPVVLDA